MLSNEVIGIAGVFLFTFSMIGLYHLICQLGPIAKRQSDRKHRDHLNKPSRDWQRVNVRKSADDDDAWWLWDPAPDNRPGRSKTGFGENRQ